MQYPMLLERPFEQRDRTWALGGRGLGLNGALPHASPVPGAVTPLCASVSPSVRRDREESLLRGVVVRRRGVDTHQCSHEGPVLSTDSHSDARCSAGMPRAPLCPGLSWACSWFSVPGSLCEITFLLSACLVIASLAPPEGTNHQSGARRHSGHCCLSGASWRMRRIICAAGSRELWQELPRGPGGLPGGGGRDG